MSNEHISRYFSKLKSVLCNNSLEISSSDDIEATTIAFILNNYKF